MVKLINDARGQSDLTECTETKFSGNVRELQGSSPGPKEKLTILNHFIWTKRVHMRRLHWIEGLTLNAWLDYWRTTDAGVNVFPSDFSTSDGWRWSGGLSAFHIERLQFQVPDTLATLVPDASSQLPGSLTSWTAGTRCVSTPLQISGLKFWRGKQISHQRNKRRNLPTNNLVLEEEKCQTESYCFKQTQLVALLITHTVSQSVSPSAAESNLLFI